MGKGYGGLGANNYSGSRVRLKVGLICGVFIANFKIRGPTRGPKT